MMTSFKCIYPGPSELKPGHSGTHAISLDLSTKTEWDGIFV